MIHSNLDHKGATAPLLFAYMESVQHSNIAEEEMAQLHSLHLSMNAIDRIRSQQHRGPSRSECVECGEAIPRARQLAVPGCSRCVHCQNLAETGK